MLYAQSTLEQLVFLRGELERDRCVDAFLVAALLGLLHGNHSTAGATRGLSISMPNTFAMSPGYVRTYIEEHELEAPQVDVFQMLRRRVGQLDLPSSRIDGGRSWTQDSTRPAPQWLQTGKVKLVFTSPPYLQVIKYGKYNWVRLWFLDEEPRAVDERLTDTGSLMRYRAFMAETLANLDGIVRDDGYVCLVIGDVRREGSDSINLAGDVWSNVAQPQGWRLHGIVNDRLPVGRKVSRIWKDTPGRATRTDRILILSRAGTDHELPALGRITWERRLTWPAVASAGGIT
jgi:site-specific DNA-methyltransferase (adenine-specific)